MSRRCRSPSRCLPLAARIPTIAPPPPAASAAAQSVRVITPEQIDDILEFDMELQATRAAPRQEPAAMPPISCRTRRAR